MNKRFRVAELKSGNFVVMSHTHDEYNALSDDAERVRAQIIHIRVGGMMSPLLAKTYADQICDQLNQFDIANATVAKLS